MENSNAFRRNDRSTRAPTRANREGKIKNGLGDSRKPFIRFDSDKEIQAFCLGWAWLDFDGFGWI
jgi:hypothetical protein